MVVIVVGTCTCGCFVDEVVDVTGFVFLAFLSLSLVTVIRPEKTIN